MMKPLKGKVALLFQNSRSGGWSLAVSLARLGADVVVVCQYADYADAERAHEAKNRIEAEDQHCLIIPIHVLNDASSREVVRQTIEMFGGLDLFIDYSLPEENVGESKERVHPAHESAANNQQRPLVHFEMLTAALDQIVDVDVAVE